MIEILEKWWCRHFHSGLLRPASGQYRCSVCLRSWPVPWGAQTLTQHNIDLPMENENER